MDSHVLLIEEMQHQSALGEKLTDAVIAGARLRNAFVHRLDARTLRLRSGGMDCSISESAAAALLCSTDRLIVLTQIRQEPLCLRTRSLVQLANDIRARAGWSSGIGGATRPFDIIAAMDLPAFFYKRECNSGAFWSLTNIDLAGFVRPNVRIIDGVGAWRADRRAERLRAAFSIGVGRTRLARAQTEPLEHLKIAA